MKKQKPTQIRPTKKQELSNKKLEQETINSHKEFLNIQTEDNEESQDETDIEISPNKITKATQIKLISLENAFEYNSNGDFISLTYDPTILKELKEDIHRLKPHIKKADIYNEVAKYTFKNLQTNWKEYTNETLKTWVTIKSKHNRKMLQGIFWTDQNLKLISQLWEYGFVAYGNYVSEGTIKYLTELAIYNPKNIIMTSKNINTKSSGYKTIERYLGQSKNRKTS